MGRRRMGIERRRRMGMERRRRRRGDGEGGWGMGDGDEEDNKHHQNEKSRGTAETCCLRKVLRVPVLACRLQRCSLHANLAKFLAP